MACEASSDAIGLDEQLASLDIAGHFLPLLNGALVLSHRVIGPDHKRVR